MTIATLRRQFPLLQVSAMAPPLPGTSSSADRLWVGCGGLRSPVAGKDLLARGGCNGLGLLTEEDGGWSG